MRRVQIRKPTHGGLSWLIVIGRNQRFFFFRRPSLCAAPMATKPAPISAAVPGSATFLGVFAFFLGVFAFFLAFLFVVFLFVVFLLVTTPADACSDPNPRNGATSKAPSIRSRSLISATFLTSFPVWNAPTLLKRCNSRTRTNNPLIIS